jgi:hypothetical protein
MFSTNRSSAESVDTAVLVRADGGVERLDPVAIAATDEPIIATVVVGNAIAAGTADLLCADIAGRVDAPGGTVEVVTETFDAVRWYQGDRDPLQRTVHATCPVDGGSS